MKKILSLVVLVSFITILSLAQSVGAAHKTIEYQASWDYGRNVGVYAYSNVSTSTRYHSSTVTCGSSSSMSGTVGPGTTSYANLWVNVWDGPNYYYNIW